MAESWTITYSYLEFAIVFLRFGEPGVVVHTYDLSPWEPETAGSWVQGQLEQDPVSNKQMNKQTSKQ
jgi:hypothetical protein